jgi:hypothetical protein
MGPKPKFLVTNMSRQSAARLATACAFRWPPVRDGILHRDIKAIRVICLCVLQRAFVFFIP